MICKISDNGITLSSQMLKFAMGCLLVIVIFFAIWWFFFHNASERTAEQNMARLYNAVELACTAPGETISVENFNLPQDFLLKLPESLGTDPYFYVYYEKFPPDPPYEFGTGVPETFMSVMAPWTEDMPWSSNIMTTALLDMGSLGLDVYNTKGLKDMAGSAKRKILDYWNKALNSEELAEFRDIIQAINAGGEKVSQIYGFTVKEGKLLLKSGKYLIGAAAAGTAACLYFFRDKTLGECALIAAGGTGAAYATYRIFPRAYKAVKDYVISSGIKLAKSDIEEVAMGLENRGDWQTLLDELENLGLVERIYNPDGTLEMITFKDGAYRNALEEYWNEQGRQDLINGYMKFEQENGVLTRIRLLPTEFKDYLKRKIINPIENSLNSLLGPVFDKEMGGSYGIYVFGHDASIYLNPGDVDYVEKAGIWQTIIKNANDLGRDIPVDYNDVDAVTKWVQENGANLEKQGGLGKMLLMSAGSDISVLLSGTEGDIGRNIGDYFSKAAKDSQESARLADLMTLKEFRISENIQQAVQKISQSPVGYSLLRIQDIYTPLGATYWDKQISFYSTGTACGERELCLQMGFYVRRYQLPSSCDDVTNVVLERSSVVASNPNFYLVSPCVADLTVRKEGDTIYIKPKLCPNKNPNYCFASGSLVNWYVGLETAGFWSNCISTGVCAVFEAVPEGGLSLRAVAQSCLGVGGGWPSECSLLGDFFKLTFDLAREGIINYPYVPEWIQDERGSQEC